MNLRFLISAILATALASPSQAQMRSAGSTPGFAGGTPHRGMVVNFGHGREERRFGGRPIFLGLPYFYDGYDQPVVSQAPPPQVIVMQPAAPVAANPPTEAPEPIVIEWQGDHFVRMKLSEVSARAESPSPDYSQKFSRMKPSPKSPLPVAKDVPPAVLLFRDGRKEEVSKYTIIGATMYASSDYWTSGKWTRKIQLTELDVPATIKLNQERGVNFAVPASPNEVVIRP